MDYSEAKENIYDNTGTGVLIPTAGDDMLACISFIRKEASCNDETTKLIWCDLEMDYGTGENNLVIAAKEDYKIEQTKEAYQCRNNAECPYYHSKNTEKVSSISKAGSVALWGIFAINKIGKQ